MKHIIFSIEVTLYSVSNTFKIFDANGLLCKEILNLMNVDQNIFVKKQICKHYMTAYRKNNGSLCCIIESGADKITFHGRLHHVNLKGNNTPSGSSIFLKII